MNLQISTLKANLLHLVGWQQNYDTADFTIASSLIQSDSGKYFQEAHPMLTLPNMKSVAPNFTQITYTAWSPSTVYAVGARVTRTSINYKALVANSNKDPQTQPTYWEAFTAFDDWLEDKTEAAIVSTIEDIYNRKMIMKQARGLMEEKPLFTTAGKFSDTIANTDKLVGFEIVPVRGRGVTVRLHQIGFQSSADTTFDVYLYHSSTKTYIQTKELAYVGNGGVQWFALNWDLAYDVYMGGSFYLCYSQNELTGLAINSGRDFSKTPCSSCKGDFQMWQMWSKYLEVHPFSISDASTMWDISQNVYTYTMNYGLNLKLSVYCDATDFIVKNKYDFAQAIQLGVTLKMLRELAHNPQSRINRSEATVSRGDLLFEIEGDPRGRPSGLKYDYDKAVNSIMIELNGLDKICQPCQRTGVNYATI